MEEEARKEKERHARRKNLVFKKGQKWTDKTKLKDWIKSNAKIWEVNEELKVRTKGQVKIVEYEKKRSRQEFWYRREEVRREGQYEIDEDLTYNERAARHELVRWGRAVREEGKVCRIENKYAVLSGFGGYEYIKWNKMVEMYNVETPREEVDWWKWNEGRKKNEKEEKKRGKEEAEDW